MKIKLWGIDSPEMDQDHGTGAQRNLGAITPSGTRITIHPLTMDQYGQVVGTVGEPGEWSVNFLMVAQGWAYHYQEFSAKGNRCFLEAERLARDNRLGVWRGGSEGQSTPLGSPPHKKQPRSGGETVIREREAPRKRGVFLLPSSFPAGTGRINRRRRVLRTSASSGHCGPGHAPRSG